MSSDKIVFTVEFDPEQQEPGGEHRKPIHTYSHPQFLTYFKISPPDNILSAWDHWHSKQTNEALNVLNCLFIWQPPRQQQITVNRRLSEEDLCDSWVLKIQFCIHIVYPHKPVWETGRY